MCCAKEGATEIPFFSFFLKCASGLTAIIRRQQDRTDLQQDIYSGYINAVAQDMPISQVGVWDWKDKLHLWAAAIVLTCPQRQSTQG